MIRVGPSRGYHFSGSIRLDAANRLGSGKGDNTLEKIEYGFQFTDTRAAHSKPKKLVRQRRILLRKINVKNLWSRWYLLCNQEVSGEEEEEKKTKVYAEGDSE